MDVATISGSAALETTDGYDVSLRMVSYHIDITLDSLSFTTDSLDSFFPFSIFFRSSSTGTVLTT